MSLKKAANDRIAVRGRSGDAGINAGQARSGQRRPKVGEKDGLQSHARFGGDQVRDPKVFAQGDSRHISKLISASKAGTIKQPKWFGLLLGPEGSVHHLILKNGYFVTMHMLSRRLYTMVGHRHQMRECARNNELQCNKNDEEPTKHIVSFRPSTINTSRGLVVKSEEALQLLESHDYVRSGVLRSASAICASLPFERGAAFVKWALRPSSLRSA
ncbi:hypothetical protein [Tritonibacter mobilis]|uniref:hypothetical protein n=1 Tax=Tritonibacter mobilis TaxID=379347 RepID=UPI0039A536E4